MKKILLSFALISFLPLCSARALKVDKIAHFSTSYVACDFLYKTIEVGYYTASKKTKIKKRFYPPHLGHRIMVVALINAIGHVKETGDSHYDKGDIWANALGSALWLLKMQVKF